MHFGVKAMERGVRVGHVGIDTLPYWEMIVCKFSRDRAVSFKRPFDSGGNAFYAVVQEHGNYGIYSSSFSAAGAAAAGSQAAGVPTSIL